jgi:DNA-binding response OmpR family regulator
MSTARILIAEDDESIIASLDFLMRRCNFDTRLARDGMDAVRLVGEFRPHVAILDLMLPRRSGLDVCRVIRGNEAWRGTRVLMLTARSGTREHAQGIAAGADDYVIKPFATSDLVGRVKALIAQGAE